LSTYPQNCPIELQKIKQRGGLNISGQELTSDSFLHLWKCFDEERIKKKQHVKESIITEKKLIKNNNWRKARKRNSKKNTLTEICNMPAEELIRFNEELESILEENIEQDVIIKSVEQDESETDDDDDDISDCGKNTDNNPINELSNKLNIKNIYIQNVLNFSNKFKIPKHKSITSDSKLCSDLKDLNYSIHEVKGDGVWCNNYYQLLVFDINFYFSTFIYNACYILYLFQLIFSITFYFYYYLLILLLF
jgi:hypothetical protein